MLIRKMLREMGKNKGQFLSILILSFLATFIYSGFESNVVGSRSAVDTFHDETHLADGWLYSEGFTEDNLKAVKELGFIESAQLRTEIKGTVPDFGEAETHFMLMDESVILTPYLYKTKENKLKEADSIPFDPKDKDGVWLNWSFANEWDIKVGDYLKLEHNGLSFERKVRGLIMTPEYEYTKAEKDADINFKNLAYVYMGYDAFPFREYVNHNIDTGKITISTLKENEETKEAIEKKLDAIGISLDDLTDDMLPSIIDKMSDEKLRKLVPYTLCRYFINADKSDTCQCLLYTF